MQAGKKVIAAIQARMNSTRIPGKPLMVINDRTMLEHMITRLKACKTVDLICVATTDTPQDDEMVAFLEEKGMPYFRGSEEDIVSRLFGTVKKFDASALVRVWGDCPLIAPPIANLLHSHSE